MCKIAPLDPAEEGQDQGKVVGGNTGPSVPHTNGSKGKCQKMKFQQKGITSKVFELGG